MTPYYEHDGITIYHARCEDVLPSIDPADVSLVLTDPPYGMNLKTDYGERGRGKWAVAKDYPPVAGDDEPFDPAPLLLFRRCVLFGANWYGSRLPDSGSWLVWNRETGGADAADAELAWTNLGGTVRMFTHRWNGALRESERGFSVHPTQKPAALMRWIIDRWTKPGDLVLDPYMGSGPVAQACHELGRRYIGVELVEEYCAVAVTRLRQQTFDFDGAA